MGVPLRAALTCAALQLAMAYRPGGLRRSLAIRSYFSPMCYSFTAMTTVSMRCCSSITVDGALNVDDALATADGKCGWVGDHGIGRQRLLGNSFNLASA